MKEVDFDHKSKVTSNLPFMHDENTKPQYIREYDKWCLKYPR